MLVRGFALCAGLLVACGGDTPVGPDAMPAPDATPPDPICGSPTAWLAGTGTVAGVIDGAELSVASGVCTSERNYYAPVGEDAVVEVSALSAGGVYVAEISAVDDLSVYVATACTATAATACLAFADETISGREVVAFQAPADGRVAIVVDAWDGSPTSGAFDLTVRAVECGPDVPSTCPGDRPACVNYACVECTDVFDCTSADAPRCDAAGTCQAGPSACVGDDIHEPDDGPSAANALAFPTVGAPTVHAGAVCSETRAEGDWFALDVPEGGPLVVELAWVDTTADLDVYVLTPGGVVIAQAASSAAQPEVLLTPLDAGRYFVVVDAYAPDSATSTVAVPYTLTARLPECASDFDCVDTTRPVCSRTGECLAASQACVGDDASDGGDSDDGPSVARPVALVVGSPVTVTAAICDEPEAEYDYYQVDVVAGQGLALELAWADSIADLDLYIYDEVGQLVGAALWQAPEHIDLTYPPAGRYFALVDRFAGGATTASTTYALTLTASAPAACVDAADCAASYANQLYRGDCTAGVCAFIAPGSRADGLACDSGDDCASDRCGYVLFAAGAEAAVCSPSCDDDSGCASLGAGYGCFTAFGTCVPTCTTDLDCGADPAGSDLTAGQPWDYFTCTAATGHCAL